eukprot:gene35759-46399_t
MKDNVRKLQLKLLSISELYHDICQPYKLWDVSLRLLHAARSADHDLINEGQQFLHSKRGRDKDKVLAIVILEELEDIAATLSVCQAPIGRGILLDSFLDTGVSFGGLLELYIELFDLWSAKKPAEKQLQILSSASAILLQWIDIALQRSTLADSAAFSRELMLSIRSGRMRGWQEKLRRCTSTLSSKLSNVDDARSRKLLEDISHEFYRINNRITELTVV